MFMPRFSILCSFNFEFDQERPTDTQYVNRGIALYITMAMEVSMNNYYVYMGIKL